MDYLLAIRAFVRSAEIGSFSAAAEELSMKVSTVSRYITALESDLGVGLLNRTTRTIALTEAGRTFYDRTKCVLADLEEARLAAGVYNSTPRGQLRITTPGAFGRRHVMPYIDEFSSLYSDIQLDINLSDQTIDLIDAGYDVAIRIGNLSDSSLIGRRIGTQRRRLVASPDFLARHAPILSPDDLADRECLLFAFQAHREHWFCWPAGVDEAVKRVEVNGSIRVNDSDALLHLARAGKGLALLPDWILAEDITAGQLHFVLPDLYWSTHEQPDTGIFALYPQGKIVSTKVRSFIDFISSKYRTLHRLEDVPA